MRITFIGKNPTFLKSTLVAAWTQVIVGEIVNTSLEKVMDYAAASAFLLSILATFVSLFLIGVRVFHPNL